MSEDLRSLHRRRVRRLRELDVDVKELTPAETRAALARFASVFMGVERTRAFLAEVDAAQASGREMKFGQWLSYGEPPPALRPRFGWLSNWTPGATCVRFERSPALPALRLSITGMLDEWAFSWPGAYASFDAQRAMIVSLDYEVTCFDPSTTRNTPYR